MSCRCTEDHDRRPETPCALCAEKHLGAALALAHEPGYVAPNRQRIIGELCAAEIHLHKIHPETAGRIRAIRHAIQLRQPQTVNWHAICMEMDALAAAEAATTGENGHDAQ